MTESFLQQLYVVYLTLVSGQRQMILQELLASFPPSLLNALMKYCSLLSMTEFAVICICVAPNPSNPGPDALPSLVGSNPLPQILHSGDKMPIVRKMIIHFSVSLRTQRESCDAMPLNWYYIHQVVALNKKPVIAMPLNSTLILN